MSRASLREDDDGEAALINAYARQSSSDGDNALAAGDGDADEEDALVEGDADFLIGFSVHRVDVEDEDESLTVCEIIDLPHGHFLFRLSPSMVLVPFEEGIVVSCDETRRRLTIDPPYGLLEARDELAYVQQRVRALMDAANLDSFPSYAQLAQDAELYEAVMRLGGRYLISCSMEGVHFENRRQQQGTWDIEGIRAQLMMYLGIIDDDENGIPEHEIQMPRSTKLMRERRWDLHHGILHAGGYARVAAALGWRYGRKPYIPGLRRITAYPVGDELDDALRAYMRQTAGDAVEWETLPRMTTLKAQRPELHRGIIHDGGHFVVSARLGLKAVSQKKGPKMSMDDVVTHVRLFMEAHELETFPSQRLLRGASRFDLIYWIRYHGGAVALSERMGLELARAGRPS